MEGVQIALYEKMKEPIRSVVDGMTEAIEGVMNLDKWFNAHKGTIIALGGAFLILTAGVAIVLPKLVKFLTIAPAFSDRLKPTTPAVKIRKAPPKAIIVPL